MVLNDMLSVKSTLVDHVGSSWGSRFKDCQAVKNPGRPRYFLSAFSASQTRHQSALAMLSKALWSMTSAQQPAAQTGISSAESLNARIHANKPSVIGKHVKDIFFKTHQRLNRCTFNRQRVAPDFQNQKIDGDQAADHAY
jgi:hypothetical protein